MENSFKHPLFTDNKSFDDYLLTGWGAPLAIHQWYVNKMLVCKSVGDNILGYNISDKSYDGVTLVNNMIQHWNNKLDLLSQKSELNLSVIPSNDYRTHNSVFDTVYKTLSPVNPRTHTATSNIHEPLQIQYKLECESTHNANDITHHKHRHHHGEQDSRV